MIGQSIMRLIPIGREEEESQILTRIGEGKSVEHLETIRRHKSGRLVHISVTSSPVKDRAGRIIGASKVARDVSERKWAEALLREREEQLRLYAEHSPVAVAMFDRGMRYIVASRRWMEDYRLVGQAIVGRSHYDVFPEISDRWKEIHRRCLEGAVEKCEEEAFPRADATIDWIRWEVRPWRQSDGTIGGIIIFSENITARKIADATLRAAEERTRFALQNAGVGIWDMDYATGDVAWSEEVEAHYGLASGTFAGTFDAVLACMHPEDRPALLERVGKAAEAGGDFVTEHRAVWPDGTIHWLSGAGRVLLNERGEPFRAVGISQDITSRRLLEQQYQQAQKMEAIGRLAGGVAHDFNNLLTAILGYCELLLDNVKTEDPLRLDIEEIQRAGTSAARLTRQLLAFSRKQIIEPALLDVNAIIVGMRGMIGRLIGEQISIRVNLAADPMMVFADAGQIEQVLLNLSVNAKDAMPNGGTLTLQTARVELDENYAATHFATKPGTYVALSVTDTGTGMTPEVKAHLFEPFFTTKEVGKGTGLGLATVHGIVARCCGSVGVYSEIGHGTSFVVYLPAADEVPVGSPAVAVASVHARASGETVLVVEDADGLRELARRLLQRHGFRALVASNAEEAARLFDQHDEIDVLLTDVIMPGATGPELTAQLVRRRPGLKVIYMSGYTEDAIVQHGVLKPGIAFLHKPFNSDTLFRKIQEVLGR
jgi:PAS domain S-box-containing protein